MYIAPIDLIDVQHYAQADSMATAAPRLWQPECVSLFAFQ